MMVVIVRAVRCVLTASNTRILYCIVFMVRQLNGFAEYSSSSAVSHSSSNVGVSGEQYPRRRARSVTELTLT